MPKKKQVSVRLNEIEIGLVDVMALKGSRERWFRGMIRVEARRQEPIHEATINGLLQAAKDALARGEDDAEYRKRIAEYKSELAILHKGAS